MPTTHTDTDTDTELFCVRCRQVFTWRADDQAWYASMGWLPPKRCGACRVKVRAMRETAPEPADDDDDVIVPPVDILKDETIVCLDCRAPFRFTAAARIRMQDDYGARFRPPVRCRTCSTARRQQFADRHEARARSARRRDG